MKYASIDIGTNTVLMLIADYKNGRLEDVLDLAVITRLGEGLKQTGILSEAAMDRTFSALARYRGEAEKQGVEGIYCVGTAAMREASNGGAFVERVREKLGITIRIISGREEAYYTYLSVVHDGFPGMDRFIIVDIGGGSTEIIAGNKTGFEDFVSLPVGSVKLTEMFIRSDPPKIQEIEELIGYLKKTVTTPFDGKGRRIVGTAGTVTNLAGIVLGLDSYDKGRVHGFHVGIKEIEEAVAGMKGLTVAERSRMKGMEAGREDILLQGIILMKEIMEYFGAEDLVASANGVRYGVLYEKLRAVED
jgi:exopolyphosphatase / guanosine-5'-triphosphate,3'-diphosphate pyrophosphatase